MPDGYTFSKFYVTSKQVAQTYPDDLSRWKEVERSFKLHSRELAAGIVVLVLLEKEIDVVAPMIKIKSDYYDVEVRESDVEKGVAIQFTTENCDYVNVYTSPTNFVKVDAKVGYVDLYFNKDYPENITKENKQKLIIDTDMYVMKVWCEYVFNNCYPFILEAIEKRKYDLYLYPRSVEDRRNEFDYLLLDATENILLF